LCADSVRILRSIDDDGQEMNGELDQPFGSMRDLATKSQCIARLQKVSIATVAILDLTLEHINEFGPGMLEAGKDFAGVVHGDEEGLEALARTSVVGEKVIG